MCVRKTKRPACPEAQNSAGSVMFSSSSHCLTSFCHHNSRFVIMMRNATPTVGPSNVLDNLGRRLLQWNFREEWKETHGGGSSATIPPNLILRDLPNTFISAQHYIDMWEPLVVREIQENVLSDVRNNLSSLFIQKCSLKARDDIETATLVHLDMTSSVDDESRPEL